MYSCIFCGKNMGYKSYKHYIISGSGKFKTRQVFHAQCFYDYINKQKENKKG